MTFDEWLFEHSVELADGNKSRAELMRLSWDAAIAEAVRKEREVLMTQRHHCQMCDGTNADCSPCEGFPIPQDCRDYRREDAMTFEQYYGDCPPNREGSREAYKRWKDRKTVWIKAQIEAQINMRERAAHVADEHICGCGDHATEAGRRIRLLCVEAQ